MTIIFIFVLIRQKQYPLPTFLLINFFVQHYLDNKSSCPCPEEDQCGEVCAVNWGSVSYNFTNMLIRWLDFLEGISPKFEHLQHRH